MVKWSQVHVHQDRCLQRREEAMVGYHPGVTWSHQPGTGTGSRTGFGAAKCRFCETFTIRWYPLWFSIHVSKKTQRN